MSRLSDEARRLSTLAVEFNHPMFPAKGRIVVHETARLLHEMALEIDSLKRQVAEYEQAAKR